MAKICDNKSVGVIFHDPQGRFGMIYRGNYPQAWAMIAGHCDGDSPEDAAKKEPREEGNIELVTFQPIFSGRIDNPCKRRGGDYHDWTVYYAYKYTGDFRAGSDAVEAAWATQEELQKLAGRTEYFMWKYGKIPYTEVGSLTRAIFGDAFDRRTDEEWEGGPGLEPVWYFILKNTGMLR